MVRLDLSRLPSDEIVDNIRSWLKPFAGLEDWQIADLEQLELQLSASLRSIGWTGSNRGHASSTGIVLLQTELRPTERVTAFASGNLAWVFGAPGVAMVFENDLLVRQTPCIYVGQALRNAARVSVMLPN